jgi:GcrA cell cycle regulator
VATNIWADETKVFLLKKLWAAGHSAGMIAARLDTTRNAVIGKVTRLKLTPHTTKHSFRPTRQAKRKKDRRQLAKLKPPLRALLECTPLPDPQPEDVARKTLLQLEHGECKYPVGDVRSPDFGFCALPRVIGSPYCAAHSRRCFTAPNVKAPAKSPEKETVAA